LESGKNAPSAETLWRIAQATGQTVDWFHNGTAEEMAPPPAPAAQPPPQPDAHALLAQLVAAQVRTEAAMAALAHAQMESRAEAARTSARLAQIEEGLRALLETPTGGAAARERRRARGRWGAPRESVWTRYARRYP
jgi:transcriptional regulator with XRE-family HTH domain